MLPFVGDADLPVMIIDQNRTYCGSFQNGMGEIFPFAADVLLLIEASDSSIKTDLYQKADLYAESHITEYWVVDVQASRGHVMPDSDGKQYRKNEIVIPPNPLAPKCRPTAMLDLVELFSVTEE